MKSTSPDRDFIIMCVKRDKNINIIQIKEPIMFEDILRPNNKMNLKILILGNNNNLNNLLN